VTKIILVMVAIILHPDGGKIATAKVKIPVDNMQECMYLKHQYEIHPPFVERAVVQGFYCEASS